MQPNRASSKYSRGQKKRHPLKIDKLFSLGLSHSAYVKNEQNPPYTDLSIFKVTICEWIVLDKYF